MKRVELYQKVRRAVMIDGMSRRRTASYFGINRKTVVNAGQIPGQRGGVKTGHC